MVTVDAQNVRDMAQIRNTIELLAKIFKENGASKLKAEIFRLAKFDDSEAVLPMVRLLFELLYFLEFEKIDGVCVAGFNEMTREEVVVYVKKEMAKKGFHSRDFASVPNDMSAGSREVLLAIGWLLCKQNIVPLFMNNVTSPLDVDMSKMCEGKESDALRYLRKVPLTSPADAGLRVQQLLWVNNKLQLSLRNLHALQREKNVLQHRLHEATYGVSTSSDRPHLTAFEVYLLRNPEMLKKNLQLLEQDNERLANLLKWKDNEDIFWKWMESVLDEKVKKRASVDEGPFQVPGESVAAFHDSYGELQSAIAKYEDIVEYLEKIWQEKSGDISMEDLDEIITSIEMELSTQKANIARACENPINHTQMPCFVYERPLSSKPKPLPFSPAEENGVGPNSIAEIEEEIKDLNELVTSLQLDVDSKQENFKSEMQSYSNKFQNAICIPPMDKKTYNVFGNV